MAAFALLAGALVFASVGASQRSIPTLSPTPPVPLAPVPKPHVPATPTTTPAPAPSPTPVRHVLPKTGVDTVLVALVGLAMLTGGAALRRVVAPRRGR